MQIAVVGTGLLGSAVAERLHSTGHRVTVYNRTLEKCEPLRSLGIAVAPSAAEAIQRADCTLLFLADAAAIDAVLSTQQARAALPGRIIVQMGTIGPDESRALERAVTAAGASYLEAPVLGSVSEAKSGASLVMVGGAPERQHRCEPVWRALTREPYYVGPVGQAATLKLALNHLIAAETAAFGLSMALVTRAKIPVPVFMAVLRQSALFAKTFDKKLPRLEQQQYDHPNFSTRHLLKDVDLVLSSAKEQGLRTVVVEALRTVLVEALARGHGEDDYSALYEVLRPPPA